MRVLIAEDDFTSRQFLYKFLSHYATCDMTVDGIETLDAYLLSLKERLPYDLICLDIMMPKADGVKVLKAIRDLETQRGICPDKRVKVIMTTALGETQLVNIAFDIGCDAYVSKPIELDKLFEILQSLKLVE